MGGFSGPANARTGITETWDGSSWTEVNDMNTARDSTGGFGIVTTALVTGGRTPPAIVANVELFNGTSFAEQNDLSAAREWNGATGTTSNGLVFGGDTPSAKANAYRRMDWSWHSCWSMVKSS